MAEALASKAAPAHHHTAVVSLFWDGRILLGILIGLYALHAWVRLTFTTAVEVDHAEQLVLSQHLQGLYGLRQPPLYTWLLHGLEQIFGPQRANAVLLKYACFIGAWVCYWRAARELGADPRLAGLAMLALAWLYQLVWKLHHGITHTALLTLAACATLWLCLRLREHQRPRDYLALGLAIAIGILSKHGYWALLLCLFLASCGDPVLRRAWLKPHAALIALPVLLIAGPYLTALMHASHGLGAEYASTLKVGTDSTSFWVGLHSLCLAVIGFLSPFCLLVLAFLFHLSRNGGATKLAATWGERLLWRLSALLLCTLTLMLLGGARGFVERWLHPFLLWLPLACVLWSARHGVLAPGSRSSRILIGGAMGLLVTSLAYQTAQDVIGPPWCGKCRPLLNYQALTDTLEGEELEAATVIAADEHIAANLRIALSALNLVVPRYAHALPKAHPQHDCVLIWPQEQSDQPPQTLVTFASDWCGLQPQARQPRFVGQNLAAWRQRYPHWQRHLAPPMDDQAYGWMLAVMPRESGL